MDGSRVRVTEHVVGARDAEQRTRDNGQCAWSSARCICIRYTVLQPRLMGPLQAHIALAKPGRCAFLSSSALEEILHWQIR